MTLANTAFHLNARRHRAWPGPRLILVTDDVRLPDPGPAIRRLPVGSGVLLRHGNDNSGGDAAMLALCRVRRISVLVAGDWRRAARLGADGLHLSESLGRHGVLAAVLGWARRHRRLVTMACHSPAALNRARRLGVDAALLSPVFPTASHPGAKTIGAVRFGLWVRRAGVPVLALGGIDRSTARRLPPGLAAGLAAISGLAR